jgi:hypothetical protein
MAEESIEWTAFICPQGHFEWLVMPLGLKIPLPYFKEKCKISLMKIKNSYWSILMIF